MPSIVPVPAFQDNYLWVIREGRFAAVVDPGDAAPVLAYLEREGLALAAILNTHHHADHIGGNAALLERYRVPVWGPADPRIPQVDHPVSEGMRLDIPELGIGLEVLEVPGHTRSHVAYHGHGWLFCGDTLFVCGCGRLFEGTPADMHASLAKLVALDPATQVYCAHEYTASNIRFARAVEPANAALAAAEAQCRARRDRGEPTVPSTMGRELATNPFLRCTEPDVVAAASRHAGKALADPVAVLAEIRAWKNAF